MTVSSLSLPTDPVLSISHPHTQWSSLPKEQVQLPSYISIYLAECQIPWTTLALQPVEPQLDVLNGYLGGAALIREYEHEVERGEIRQGIFPYYGENSFLKLSDKFCDHLNLPYQMTFLGFNMGLGEVRELSMDMELQ